MAFGDEVMDLVVGKDQEGERLDVFLGTVIEQLSRTRIQQLIRQGSIQVNQTPSKPGYRIKEGDLVHLHIPPPRTPQGIKPEKVPFGVVYEDDSILVVNKPPGVVVHPAPGHQTGTLVHGLLDYCKDLAGIGGELRPGIVHRLDKDTSGLMVVAKSQRAYQRLARQFKKGRVKKEYHAIVYGIPRAICGTIEAPIGRHRYKRKEMSVDLAKGRYAVSDWKKIGEYGGRFALVLVRIKTGRTHQIRVHLAYMGHPIVGDPVYGHGKNWWKNTKSWASGIPLEGVSRQMLHAYRLAFVHPDSGEEMRFEAGYPPDIENFLYALNALERA